MHYRILIFSMFILIALSSVFAGKSDPNWPKTAQCVVCASGDPNMAPEPVKAASAFEGKTYYFCNSTCKEQFDASPYTYIMLPLPRPAVDFVLPSLVGTDSLALAGRRGSWTLIDFWATWCAPCKAMTDDLISLQTDFKQRNFSVVSIAIDDDGPKKPLAYVQKKKVNYLTLYDGPTSKVWEKWKAAGLPSLYLVDPTGSVVAQWRGAVDMKKLRSEVDHWLTEVKAADQE